MCWTVLWQVIVAVCDDIDDMGLLKQFCYKYLMPLFLLGGSFPRTLKDLDTLWFSDYISEKIKLKNMAK